MSLTIIHGQKPGDPELPALLQQAVDAHQDGRLDIAAPLYRRFLAQNTSHPLALQLLGLLHSQRGEYETAIELMRESLQQFPEQAEVANNLGNALSNCGRLEEAADSYTMAVKLDPGYADAWRNLGVCQLKQGQPDAALASFRRCLEILPGDNMAWLGLGNVYQQQGFHEQAIDCYENALQIKPDYAEAHHNLGICLRIGHRTSEALEHYRTAQRLGLDRPELYHNLASALVDAGEMEAAIVAYKAAIERDPEDIISHRNLNTLLWEQDFLEEHLKSFRNALSKRPDSEKLTRAYAVALNQLQAYEDAESVLVRGLRHAPDSSELLSQLAFALEGQGRWDEALKMHGDAISIAGSTPNQRVSFVRALLACQRPDEALPHAEEAVRQTPFDQRAIAYLGLCWRMLGDGQDAILNDYEEYIRSYELPVPERYGSTETFNQALAGFLETLHLGKRHPLEQTLRGGTQTHGDLFDLQDQLIIDLVSGLKQCIREYVGGLPPGPAHPLIMRRSDEFNFSASWSVRLLRSGYHTMHMHPMGWISSAYYVQVPAVIENAENHGGDIKFGEPDIDIGEFSKPRRFITPAVGQLVLFPSYMWHGTVPFESDQPRMTVAFDVVPVH